MIALSAGPFAGQSMAAQFWSTGATGPSKTFVGHCRYYDYWQDIGLTTPAPEVYARNNRAGGGNDWQWVRYRVWVINRYNGNQSSPDGVTSKRSAR